MLGAAADALRFDFELAPEDAPARFALAVEEQIEAANAEQLRVVHNLTPLLSSVLRVMTTKWQNVLIIDRHAYSRFAVIGTNQRGRGTAEPGVWQFPC